ncbi:MAG: hypothetical protein ACOCPQ_00670 [Desulfosudaceae bacterium]
MMKSYSISILAVCGLVVALVMTPISGSAEEDRESRLDREQRESIDYNLVVEAGEKLDALLSQPTERLEEKVLQDIEKEHDITIKRSSMVRTEKCLSELLAGIPNMSKIALGKKIIRLKVNLTCDTSRATIWSPWRHRKLEAPVLTLTFYYEDGTSSPSEIVCQGHAYH